MIGQKERFKFFARAHVLHQTRSAATLTRCIDATAGGLTAKLLSVTLCGGRLEFS
jgi:hypothetical protein